MFVRGLSLLVDFAIVVVRDFFQFVLPNPTIKELLVRIKLATDPYVLSLYAVQISVYPSCALIAFEEYRTIICSYFKYLRLYKT
uniref:G_PROTEIN_RECEP_F1_2 domain-containing protein n=1 Tax=Steinernema glaseri TaxID=37863 RepID=A0A1I7YPZ4_9BILA